jgi:transposase
MYIREVKVRSKGIEYTVHRLVEAYRNSENLPRQRVILNLGKIDVPKNRWKELAFLLEQRYCGQEVLMSLSPELEKTASDLYARSSFNQAKPKAEEQVMEQRDLETVDIQSIQVSESRSLGPELAVLKMWNDLELGEILRQNGLTDRQISLAQALIFGKLISPSSELATWGWFNERTALCEMTPADIRGLGKDSFYETGDLLYSLKDNIEQALYQKETSLFNLNRRLFLFDLTNVFFEGNGLKNEQAERGKSKENRTDCPLVSLALLVDNAGFPVFSKILPGNQSEPATLKDVLEQLEGEMKQLSLGQRPTLIMDRGIATSANLKLIRESNYEYTVIERAPTEKEYGVEYKELKDLLDKDATAEQLLAEGWQRVREDATVYVRQTKRDDYTRVLVFSLKKEAKELAMDRLKETRLVEDLEKLKKSIRKRSILLSAKANERLGKIKQKYPGTNAYFDITCKLNDEGLHATDLIWEKKEIGRQRPIFAGCYVIETNKAGMNAIDIWQDYITLTRVESAFRDLKSELGLRPVYHQNAGRTQAHLFLSVLAYHLLVGIETRLKEKGEHREWKTIRSVLTTHQRMTVSMLNKEGESIRIRLSGNAETCHLEIYNALGVTDRLRKIKTIQRQRK